MIQKIGSDNPVIRRFIVFGKVQGVFFRASTQKRAKALNLTGYAKNLKNGCVEVLVSGHLLDIDKLRAWLDIGPPMATVDSVVEVDAGSDLSLTDFKML